MQSINPATGQLIREYDTWDAQHLDSVLQQVADASPAWRQTGFAERAAMMRALAAELHDNKQAYAELITTEMGKPITEAIAEV